MTFLRVYLVEPSGFEPESGRLPVLAWPQTLGSKGTPGASLGGAGALHHLAFQLENFEPAHGGFSQRSPLRISRSLCLPALRRGWVHSVVTLAAEAGSLGVPSVCSPLHA